MNKKRGRKRKANYAAVVAYAKRYPDKFQTEIAKHFGIAQGRVSQILTEAGVTGGYLGQPLKRKPNQSAEEFEWEQILHNVGLGMERGMRINKQRVLYGYDPAKETHEHESVTDNSNF